MLTSLVSPLRLGVLIGLLAMLAWRWSPRALRLLWIAAIAGCVLLTTPLVANFLVGIQESRAPAGVACSEPPPTTIVLLGGGVSLAAKDADDAGVLTESSLRRLFAAVDLHSEHPDATLVIAGGISRHTISESALLGTLATRLGVPTTMLRLEERSRTTWQNARFVAELQPQIAKRIWLVTSALHMPRARYAFEQAGFDVCSWSVDARYSSGSGIGYFVPSTTGLDKADAALHELVGEAAYRFGFLRDTARNPHSEAGED